MSPTPALYLRTATWSGACLPQCHVPAPGPPWGLLCPQVSGPPGLWAAGDVIGPALMALSPQGTSVLTVQAIDQDTGVNDKIFYIITSE